MAVNCVALKDFNTGINIYVVQLKYCTYLCLTFVQKAMTFDRILDDNRLWAVRFDGESDNCFDSLFEKWYDMNWLKTFFKENLSDLASYFRITDVYRAVMETISEASQLECLMLDISPNADLDTLFQHLENNRFSEMSLGREKAKGQSLSRPSWLRIYAIKMDSGVYLVTGGAIKLTATMSERSHTMAELAKLERVRNYLIDNGVFDTAGLIDYTNYEQDT